MLHEPIGVSDLLFTQLLGALVSMSELAPPRNKGGRQAHQHRCPKNPGRIHISNGKSYDDPGKIYHGFIDLDGGFFPRTEDKDVHDLLGTFDSDPAATASAYGRRTGRCCFCGRELTDGRSVAVGYGPICAPRYGLPWGDITISSTCEVRADMN